MKIKRIIKKLVSTKYIEQLLEMKYKLYSIKHLIFHFEEAIRLKKEQKIIYIMTPTHKNIGDAAIAEGVYAFFEKVFPQRNILEFTDLEVQKKRYYIKMICNSEDRIFFHGGGNLGDWYPAWELLRENMVQLLRQYKIIMLPQTISFGNRSDSKWLLKKAIKTYSNANIFKFVCRDEKSKRIAQQILGIKNPFIAPDTALCMKREPKIQKKYGIITLCLRNDIEKNRTREFDENLAEFCKKIGYKIHYTDTMSQEDISPRMRTNIVKKKIKELEQSDLVITDRYHGVILSYLANRPCIAIANKDDKVKESLKFFKDLDYIKFAKDFEEIIQNINKLIDIDTSKEVDFYNKYFKEIL